MWTETNMNVMESLTVSGLGLITVFLTLITLAAAIVIFSKFFSMTGIGGGKNGEKSGAAASGAVEPENEKDEDEVMGVLVAVISEEMNLPVDRFQITQIREL